MPQSSPTEWPTTTLVEHGGRRIYLVGTAHVSPRSVAEVAAVIDAVRPDTVCVELCKTRHEAMFDEARWRKLDIFQVLKQKKALFLMASLALAAFQRRLGQKFGVEPGAELKKAVERAEAAGARVVLADRDIQTTLKRTWANLGFFGRMRIRAELLAPIFGASEELTEDQLEAMKDRDTVSELFEKLAEEYPRIALPLIHERDLYLVSTVREAEGQTIVAVVGNGHVAGMLKHFETPVDRQAIEIIPPPGLLANAWQWLIPLFVVGGVAWGLYRQGATSENLLQMILAWVVTTGLGAGLGALAALAHPLTILASMLSAPITTLHPAIAVGMVAAPVEAWMRRPTVADCERISEDAQSLRAWFKNPFLRVLVVFILSNLGATVGVYVGLGRILGQS